MGKIVVIGSSNTDMVVSTERIAKPGETVLGDEFSVIQGGKGANQALAAHRAGADVAFVAKLGDDSFGQKTKQHFIENGLSTNHLLFDKEKPSGIAMILVDKNTGQNSIVVAPGANANLTPSDVHNNKALISNADAVLAQLETPIDSVEKAFELAKENNVRTILNPAPAQQLPDSLLQLTDFITPNETETETLTGIYPDNLENAKKAANKLLEKINKAVIITMGSQGAYYLTKTGEEKLVPAQKVNAVDTTAAGDVFNGYLTALMHSGSLPEVIDKANKAAAISVTRKGAQTSVPFINEIAE